jgi:hypothetical protein
MPQPLRGDHHYLQGRELMNWFDQTFRKVHLIYSSPPWTKEQGQAFDADQCADAMAEAGVDCVELYTKDHHGTCFYPCSLGLSHPRDVVGELSSALRKRNIRLIAYFSVCFDNYALGIHPEWRAVNLWGDPCMVGPFYMACWSSPYVDYALQQLEELTARYPVDGVWLDIMPYVRNMPQTSWISNALPSPCYCLNCQKGFEQETGQRLPLVSPPPVPGVTSAPPDASIQQIVCPPELAATLPEQAYEVLLRKGEAFLTRAIETVHAHSPDALVTYNCANGPGDPFDHADLVSIEGHAPQYTRQSFIARWGRAVGKPCEILVAAGLPGGPWGGLWCRHDHKPPLLLQMENAISLAHGASSTFGLFAYPNGAIDPGQYAGLGKVFRPAMELEPWLREPGSVSDVGVVLATKPRTASRLWYLMMDGAESIHEALLDGHFQYDLVRTLDDLGAYQVVFLPDQAALSEAEMECVRRYVSQGGHLLASGYSSLWDDQGRRRPDFGLADVFGVSFRRDPGLPYINIRLRDQSLISRVTAFPIFADQSVPLEVTLAGAESVADLVYPEAIRTNATTVMWGDAAPDDSQAHPGLCRHQFGKGVCWYAAWPLRARTLSNIWIRRLLKVLVTDMVPRPVLRTSAPPGVEVVLNRQAGRHVVHLVNHHLGDPDRPSYDPEDGLVLNGLSVSLDLARLKMETVHRVYVPPSQELAYQVEDDWLHIQVPPLQAHVVIAVE